MIFNSTMGGTAKLDGKEYILHHSATAKGYIAKKRFPLGKCEKYEGKFGKGWKVSKHNPASTNYCIVEYWTEV